MQHPMMGPTQWAHLFLSGISSDKRYDSSQVVILGGKNVIWLDKLMKKKYTTYLWTCVDSDSKSFGIRLHWHAGKPRHLSRLN